MVGDSWEAVFDLHALGALVALESIAWSYMPSMVATALEASTHFSKLVGDDVKANAEPLITPYRAELSRSP